MRSTNPRATYPRQTTVGRWRALGMVAVALLALSCSDKDSEDPLAQPDPTDSSNTSTSAATTTVEVSLEVDQTSPASLNGLKVDPVSGRVWVASIEGDEILDIDPATGEILARHSTPPGSGPDDLVIADDGIIYWTGFGDGSVGSLDPATGEVEILGSVQSAANPIALGPDGDLLVGRAVTASGLYRLPIGGGEATLLGDPGNLNSFDVGSDGVLYGPIMSGDIVAVDPATGSIDRVIATVGPILTGVRYVDGMLYVLQLVGGDAVVITVDPATGDSEPLASLGVSSADNLAVGDDGVVYVSGFLEPVIFQVAIDGSVTGMQVGS